MAPKRGFFIWGNREWLTGNGFKSLCFGNIGIGFGNPGDLGAVRRNSKKAPQSIYITENPTISISL
jgi:hypothetical protein